MENQTQEIIPSAWIISKPYVKDKNLTKEEEKALPNYYHPKEAKSRAERRGRLKFLPTGKTFENGKLETFLQPWRKTATGSWTRN